MDRRVPTVAFTHDRVAPDAIARALGDQNIFVWSGNNYAVEVAKTLDIFESGGAVRVRPVHYNTFEEIDDFSAALASILQNRWFQKDESRIAAAFVRLQTQSVCRVTQ